MQDLKTNSTISFKRDHVKEYQYFKDGKSTNLVGSRTEIFMTNDAFVVKITKLQKEDAGIYWIEFKSIPLRKKALVITGKRTIMERSVLKPEDNYISTIQLECHSVSASIGDCPLSMYTVWYKNGTRMTELDSTLSLINVTFGHNSRNYACLVTDDLPCYQRLQTTMHFDDVLNIEECNNVSESETFIVQPEYPPIVKLEPDQKEITVNENEDLVVKCSGKCHPKCEIRWEKELLVLGSNGSIFITENTTENIYGKYLKIVNINSSHEGFYTCLVNNIHGEVKKGFTLRVRETEEEVVNGVDNKGVIAGIVTSVIIVAVIVVVIIIVIIKYRESRKKKNTSDGNRLSGDDTERGAVALLEGNGGGTLFTGNNSKTDDQNMNKVTLV